MHTDPKLKTPLGRLCLENSMWGSFEKKMQAKVLIHYFTKSSNFSWKWQKIAYKQTFIKLFCENVWNSEPLFSKWIINNVLRRLPPLHLICQMAVLLVRTVFEPACPLSIEGDTAKIITDEKAEISPPKKILYSSNKIRKTQNEHLIIVC